MSSPNRDLLSAGSGKLLDSSDAVFDLTAMLKTMNTQMGGSGIKVAAVLDVNGYPYTVRQSAALEPSGVIKATPGTLYGVTGRIDATAATATYYVQLIDSATVPADGAVTMLMAPIKVQFVTGSDFQFNIALDPSGIAGAAGLVIVLSSTEFTKTVAGSYLSTTALFT